MTRSSGRPVVVKEQHDWRALTLWTEVMFPLQNEAHLFNMAEGVGESTSRTAEYSRVRNVVNAARKTSSRPC